MKIIGFLGLLYTTTIWGLTCSAPVTFAKDLQNDFDYYYNVNISLNNSGEAVATWIGSDDQHMCSIRESDKQWSFPIVFKREGKEWGISNDINEQGNVRIFTNNKLIRKDKGSPWSSPEDEQIPPESSLPISGRVWKKVITKNNGKVFAAWIVDQSGWIENQFVNKVTLQCSWLQNDRTWSTPFDICQVDRNKDIFDFYAIMNSKGNIALFFSYSTQVTSFQIFSTQSVVYMQGEWSPVQEITTHFSPDSRFVLDEEGNIAGIGGSMLNDTWTYSVVSKLAQQPWSASQVISSESAEYSDHIDISTDNKGHFLVTWCEFENDEGMIKGSIFSAADNQWTIPVQLSPLGKNCQHPSCALNGKGEGIISWVTQGEECELIQIAELKLD